MHKGDTPQVERAMTERRRADLLQGIRVLDLTNVLSGPFCTYQLGLLGAEVIKIEPSDDGDLARQLGTDPELNRRKMGISFLAQNSGKKSLTINLKHPDGTALFEKLVATSDVVIENFRPGVMRRLGLDYEHLSRLRPSLVYCAISGFGQTGPLRNNPAYDQIIQGMSGVMSVTGDATSAPLRVGYPLCDTLGGMTAAFATMAALFDRARTGRGRFVDVSMLDSTLVALGWVVSNFLLGGVVPMAAGNENLTAAPSGTFRAADGPLNIAANKQEQFVKLCEIVGRPDIAADPRFRERERRKSNREALRQEIEAALANRPASEWEAQLNAAGIPAGRVLTVPEILDHPQIAERALVQTLGTVPGTDRPLRVLRSGFTYSDCLPSVDRPPPTLGQNSSELLKELGLDDAGIAALSANGVI